MSWFEQNKYNNMQGAKVRISQLNLQNTSL